MYINFSARRISYLAVNVKYIMYTTCLLLCYSNIIWTAMSVHLSKIWIYLSRLPVGLTD